MLTISSDADVRLGQSKDEIETPAVVLNKTVMERNLEDFASFADEHDVSLRSHVKTHKIPAIARRQVDRTGGGVVCQTISEVEVMVDGGIDDIYLSYIVATQPKLNRLMHLSETLDSFVTTVDSKGNIDPLQAAAAEYDATVDVVLELDIGLNRTGAQPADAVELAQYISVARNLRFRGIMAFEAHIKRTAETRAEYDEQCHEAMEEVAAIVEDIEGAGIPVEEVKVGSTGTAKHSGKHPVVTEINPGMYPFNDVGELGRVSKEECALTVLTTVISVPTEDRMIVDAGSKTMAMDTGRNPVPKHRDDIKFFKLSEEHGWIDTSESNEEFSVGDRVEFIIPHVCTTINLHDSLIGLRDGVVENVWEVKARGKVK
jgi:D-serine deaminase-like pyridoxal phosphate-dependent protein